jgi:hypothetical protein
MILYLDAGGNGSHKNVGEEILKHGNVSWKNLEGKRLHREEIFATFLP